MTTIHCVPASRQAAWISKPIVWAGPQLAGRMKQSENNRALPSIASRQPVKIRVRRRRFTAATRPQDVPAGGFNVMSFWQ